MKYNRLGAYVVIMAIFLSALPATTIHAQEQRLEDSAKRNQKYDQSVTSSEDESEREKNRKQGEVDRNNNKEEGEEEISATSTNEAMEKVENRNPIKTFLIGTDYKNIGVIRSQIAKTQARINQLSRSLEQNATTTISTSTAQQLDVLKQTENKLVGFISEHENKFSLFGWFLRLFSK